MTTDTNYWVVVPAAGSGSRMQQALPKQYLSICGRTVIEHTLAVFIANSNVTQVTVCLSAEDQRFRQLKLPQKVVSTVGGASRAHSVLNGLLSLSAKDNDWVLVHDAARPCFTHALLSRLIDELAEDDVGGILAVRAKDTLKQASAEPRIECTIDRANIWHAQTPQMFRYGLLKRALSDALAAGATITDEASAMEWAGHKPKLVAGDARNIKVTTPDDLVFAEFLLQSKGSTL